MAKIIGIDGMSPQELVFEINRGGKFVVYKFCFSALLSTACYSSNIHFRRAGESGIAKGLPWSMMTFLLGWWGIPFGPIRTVQSLVANFRGGEDVTVEVASALQLQGLNWAQAAGAN